MIDSDKNIKTNLLYQEWRSFYSRVWNGQRIYSQYPTILKQNKGFDHVAVLFTIKSVIGIDELNPILDREFGPYNQRKKFTENYKSPTIILDCLKSDIEKTTWEDRNSKISKKIHNQWPDSSYFSQWLEEYHRCYWALAEYKKSSSFGRYCPDSYEFFIKIHATINETPNEYRDTWGQAIMMTKMMTGIVA